MQYYRCFKNFGGSRTFPPVMPFMSNTMPHVGPISPIAPTFPVMNSMETSYGPFTSGPISPPTWNTIPQTYPFTFFPYPYSTRRWVDKDVYEDGTEYGPEGEMESLTTMSPYAPPTMYPTGNFPISPYNSFPFWHPFFGGNTNPWMTKVKEDYRGPEREYTWGESVGDKTVGNRTTSQWVGKKYWMGDKMTTPYMMGDRMTTPYMMGDKMTPFMMGVNRMNPRMPSTMTGNRWWNDRTWSDRWVPDRWWNDRLVPDRLSPTFEMQRGMTTGCYSVYCPDGSYMICYPNGWCCIIHPNGLTSYLPFIPTFPNVTGYPTFNSPWFPTPFSGTGMNYPALMPPGPSGYNKWSEIEDPQNKNSIRAWFDSWISGEIPIEQLTREDCIGIALYYKRECGITFQQLAEKLNRSEIWTVCALMGQHRLTFKESETICDVLGVDIKFRNNMCKLLSKEPYRCALCVRSPVPFHCHYLH